MSEYQYYEWQTVDRALSPSERTAVNQLSSHIEVSSTRAWVEYHWGDFKHDPLDVLARYFDAFLYYANWGDQQVAFRFPKGMLDEQSLKPYLNDSIELYTNGDFTILKITYPAEWNDSVEYQEPPRLGSLALLREDILNGDYRMLYLAWLVGNGARDEKYYAEEFEDDFEEPVALPVPAGLGALSSALSEFIDFFNLDRFLVQAAAQASHPLQAAPTLDTTALIKRLSPGEGEDFLRRLASGEPMLKQHLIRRLQELAGQSSAAPASQTQRTRTEILEEANRLRDADKRRQQAEAEAWRVQNLKNFALQAEQA